VAAAVSFLALIDEDVPPVVHHPWEGTTVGGLLLDLGDGRAPRELPVALARAVVESAKRAGRLHPPTAANARRLELLWFGQEQDSSWLTAAGWRPPVGLEEWRRIGALIRESPSRHS
jgi:hypothetical protein